ncbi:MAG: sulfatase-like hydrolase/transferase [bacterium]|nr:sulfatase-like hydrolase/transferase [bacterium]
MKRRALIQTLAAAALHGCAGAVRRTTAAAVRRPNVVVLLADDLGYGDVGAINPESKIPTYNMNRLAREGVLFTDAHSPSAVCTPTRYGLLTGRYPWRSRLKTGVLWGWSPPLIETSRLTLGSMLQKQGYRTACVGKWHLGLDWTTSTGRKLSDSSNENGDDVDLSKQFHHGPAALGFDYSFIIPASLDMDPYCYVENDRRVAEPTERIERSGYPAYYRGGPIAPGFKHEEVLPAFTRKATGFIENHVKEHADQPFFLYFPLSAPHTPWVPKPFARQRSRAGVYGDFAYEADWAAGEVLNTLDRLGLADDTLVIMASDNGAHIDHIGQHNNGVSEGGPEDNFGHAANDGLRGQKADAWDGGHRVPFIVRWPGRIRPETRCDETVCLVDLMATLADLTGYDLPDDAGEDSFSIMPALLGVPHGGAVRESLVVESANGFYCMRKGPWKLIEGRGSGGFTQPKKIEPGPGEPVGQLYHMKHDLAESHNLFMERPDLVIKLRAELERIKNAGRSRPA